MPALFTVSLNVLTHLSPQLEISTGVDAHQLFFFSLVVFGFFDCVCVHCGGGEVGLLALALTPGF